MRNTVLLYIGLLVICAGIIPKCNATTAGEDLGMTTEATTLPPLGEPENVQANGESTTTIRVTWEEASGDPDRYTITGTDVTEKEVEADPSGNYNVTVTVDTPGTTYIITVTAIRDEDGAKKAAEGTTASTNPAPPTITSTSAESISSVRVNWTAPAGNVDNYHAEACEGVTCKESVQFGGTDRTGVIPNLEAGTVYSVRMWSTFSPETDILESIKTEGTNQATIPNPPTGVKLSPIDTKSIQVEWNAPDEGSASKYFGKACTEDVCLEQELTQGPPVDTIDGLTAGTLYTVTIWSQFDDLNSTETVGENQATKLIPASNLLLTPSGNSLILEWQGGREDYTYTAKCTSGDENKEETGITGLTYTFTGLTYGAQYTCTVESVKDGFEYIGDPASSSASLGSYTPVLRLTPLTTTTMKAEWGPEEGTVIRYTLYYEQLGTDPLIIEPGIVQTTLTDLGVNEEYIITLSVESIGNNTSAMNTSQTVSEQVSDLTPTAISDKEVNLTWNHPSDNVQGSKLASYYIEVLDNGICVKHVLLQNDDERITGPAPVINNCPGDPTTGNSFNMDDRVIQQVTDLDACNEYTFKVFPINTVITGSVDQKMATTQVGKPDGAISLTGELTTDSITLNWKQPTTPLKCDKRSNITIIYQDCPGTDTTTNTTTDYSETTLLLSGLQSYWNYTVTVEVYSYMDGTTSEGLGQTETYRTSSAVPIKPSGLGIKDNSLIHDKVSLWWNEHNPCTVNGPDPKHNLVCDYIDPLGGAAGPADINNTYPINQNTAGDLDVSIYKNYTCKLYVVNGDSHESAADELKFQTKQWTPNKIDESQITVTEHPTELIIEWTPPDPQNGEIINNTVCWKSATNTAPKSDLTCEYSKTTNGKNYTHTIRNLSAYSCYEFTVSACTHVDCSELSEFVEAQTRNGKAVSTKVYANATDSSSIKVYWDTPSENTADITMYRVNLTDTVDTGTTWTNTITGFTETEIEFKGLDEYWRYSAKLEIITWTEGNKGGDPIVNDESEEVTERTKESTPGQVQNISSVIQDKVCYKISVTIKEPTARDKNGEITSYTITPYYGSSKGDSKTCTIGDGCDVVDGEIIVNVPVNPDQTNYKFEVKAHTSVGGGEPDTSEDKTRSLCPPEIPSGGGSNSLNISDNQDGVDNTKQLKVNIDSDFFKDEKNGKITHRGIIVSDSEKTDDDNANNDDFANWDALKKEYPAWAKSNQEPELKPYRATVDGWNPFSGNRQKRQADTETFTIGEDGACDKAKEDVYCNGPLKPGRSYKVRSVRCTAGGCMVSQYAAGESAPLGVPPDIGLIVGMTIFALLLVAVIVGALYMWRSKRWPFKESSSSNDRTTGYNGAHENPIFEPEGKPDVVNALYFPEYVKDLHKDSGLKFTEQYESIKTHCAKKSMDVSTEPENRAKNRYVNILPFDFSRVKLLPQDDVPGSDYINANYMPGYNGPREFIATQGPLVCTMNDFWRMVWEQRSHIIVMLTQLTQQGRSKCDQYWPKGNEPVYYGDLAVKTVSESVLGDYTIRILEVQLGSDKRTIKQFHMTSWPDFGCPDTTDILLNFTRVVRADVRPGAGPITVHCSAGVGRTGTYIAVDRLLQHIETHDDIDIYGITMEMRDYRSYMVQTEDQYIYIHDCLKDVLEARNKQEDEDENIYENTGQTPQVEEEENIYENSNHKGNVTTDPNGHHYDNNKKALHRMSSPP